jgi:hypothetical protein
MVIETILCLLIIWIYTSDEHYMYIANVSASVSIVNRRIRTNWIYQMGNQNSSRKSKKDIQYNSLQKKDKKTNNDLQNTTQKTKEEATRTPLRARDLLRRCKLLEPIWWWPDLFNMLLKVYSWWYGTYKRCRCYRVKLDLYAHKPFRRSFEDVTRRHIHC